MDRRITRMAASFLAAILVCIFPAEAIEVSARGAALLDGDSGAVLWEKNGDTRALMASTTKIMTALLTLEQTDLDELVEIPPEAVGVEGSSIYLRPGEVLTVRDLLYGLMLSSGNDAATALAIHVGGSVEAFVEMMNKRAAELGIDGIHFANPHGLDNPENYASPVGLGRLAAAAMNNPAFREIASTKYHQFGTRSLKNHNKLLWQYPGAMGVKTGYTRSAGRILVGCAERDGRRLISVTMGAPSDWEDHRAMLDLGFSMYALQTVLEQGQTVGSVPVMSGEQTEVPLTALEKINYPMLPGEQAELRLLARPFVYAPVEQGTVLGTVQVYVNGKLAGQCPAAAAEDVPMAQEKEFWDRVLRR